MMSIITIQTSACLNKLQKMAKKTQIQNMLVDGKQFVS